MKHVRRLPLAGLALVAIFSTSCGDDDKRADAVQFHATGGIYEQTVQENPGFRLHPLDNTAVILLEPVGTHAGDTGDDEGVDELGYQLDLPPDTKLSLGDFEDAPTLVVLDRNGSEIARLDKGASEATIASRGAHTLRFEHPKKGDPNADRIVIFVHGTTATAAVTRGSPTTTTSTVDLRASSSCEGCDLSGLVWDACSSGGATVTARNELDESSQVVNVGFEGATFADADLRCVRFQPPSGGGGPTRFNMKSARFDGATLFRVTLDRTDHDDGSLRGLAFQSSVFRLAHAPGADFANARFAGVALSDDGEIGQSCVNFRNLRSAQFDGATFDDRTTVFATLFNGGNLASAQFLGTEFQRTFPDCDLPVDVEDDMNCLFLDDGVCHTDFDCVRDSNGLCVASTILGSDPLQLMPSGVLFDSVDLSGISFQEADLRFATFRNTTLDADTDFIEANLFNASFPQTDVSAIRFSFSFGVSQIDFIDSTLSADGRGVDLSCVPELGTGLCAPRNFTGFDLQHVKLRNTSLMQTSLANANLSGTDLTGSDLRNAMLAGAIIDAATIFSDANLIGTDFTDTNLIDADLSGAFLSDSVLTAQLSDATAERGANLSCDRLAGTGLCDLAGTTAFKGRDLRYVGLNNIGLEEADLEGTSFDGAELIGANFNFANLKGASFVGARLGVSPGGALAAASLRGAYLINVDLTDADLRGADLTEAHAYGAASDALFVRTKLDSANLSGAVLSEAIFTNASLTDAVFDQAQLTNVSFDGANLTNAKFDNAYLQGANFSGAAAISGMNLSNAAISTTLTSTQCTLTPPGSWTYTEQDGTPYTYSFATTTLRTDTSVICPNSSFGPCLSADSLCPVRNGPFPPIPPCTPLQHYCWVNCEMPPVFTEIFPSCF